MPQRQSQESSLGNSTVELHAYQLSALTPLNYLAINKTISVCLLKINVHIKKRVKGNTQGY